VVFLHIFWLLGTDLNFWLDAITYLLSAYLLYSIINAPINIEEAEEKPEVETEIEIESSIEKNENTLDINYTTKNISIYRIIVLQILDASKMFKEGLIMLYSDKYLFLIANAKGLTGLIWGGQDIINIATASRVYKIGDNASLSIGLLYGSLGIATGVGPIICAKILGNDTPKNSERALLIGYFIFCIGSFLIVFTPSFWLWILFNILRASGSGTIWVYSSSILMGYSSKKFLGRVFAYDIGALTLASTLTKTLSGFVIDYVGFSIKFTALIVALFSVVLFIFWAISLNKIKPKNNDTTMFELLPTDTYTNNIDNTDTDTNNIDNTDTDTNLTLSPTTTTNIVL